MNQFLNHLALQFVLQGTSLRDAPCNEFALDEEKALLKVEEFDIHPHPHDLALFRERTASTRYLAELFFFQCPVERISVFALSLSTGMIDSLIFTNTNVEDFWTGAAQDKSRTRARANATMRAVRMMGIAVS